MARVTSYLKVHLWQSRHTMLRTEFPLLPRFAPEGVLTVKHEKELHVIKSVASQIA